MFDATTVTETVRELMATTFDMPEQDISDDISQETCARWTSLNHMMLLVALEEQFEVTFAMDEMSKMTSLAKIVATLQRYGVGA